MSRRDGWRFLFLPPPEYISVLASLTACSFSSRFYILMVVPDRNVGTYSSEADVFLRATLCWLSGVFAEGECVGPGPGFTPPCVWVCPVVPPCCLRRSLCLGITL